LTPLKKKVPENDLFILVSMRNEAENDYGNFQVGCSQSAYISSTPQSCGIKAAK
jgi:hypothetical protein